MKKLLLSVMLVLLSTGAVNDANAHPGRTNSEGCHNDRKNGGYHCHGAKRKSADYFASEPVAPARSPEKKSVNKKTRTQLLALRLLHKNLKMKCSSALWIIHRSGCNVASTDKIFTPTGSRQPNVVLIAKLGANLPSE